MDLATLTGAIGTALGVHIRAGLFSNDSSLEENLMAAADHSGDLLWPFPMDAEYEKPIKSDMAEVKNSAGRSGVSSSAKFIEHFTEGYPWAHLDIANMVLADSGSTRRRRRARPDTACGCWLNWQSGMRPPPDLRLEARQRQESDAGD